MNANFFKKKKISFRRVIEIYDNDVAKISLDSCNVNECRIRFAVYRKNPG